jgi:DNA repair protein RecO (recombination protein O)
VRTQKLRGIIIKRTNFGEADRIITVFSCEQGKINCLAKGVRRIKSRRAPHLELFHEVNLVLHESRGWGIITQAAAFPLAFANHLPSVAYAFYAAEVVDKLLPEHQPHEDVYQLLRKFFRQEILDESKTKEFVVCLLWRLGYLPRGQYPKEGVTAFVESVAEKKVKSRKFLEEV